MRILERLLKVNFIKCPECGGRAIFYPLEDESVCTKCGWHQ